MQAITSQAIQVIVDRWRGGAAITSCAGVKKFAAVGVNATSPLGRWLFKSMILPFIVAQNPCAAGVLERRPALAGQCPFAFWRAHDRSRRRQ